MLVYHHLQERDQLEAGVNNVRITFPGGIVVPSPSELQHVTTTSPEGHGGDGDEGGTQRTYTLAAPSVLGHHDDRHSSDTPDTLSNESHFGLNSLTKQQQQQLLQASI